MNAFSRLPGETRIEHTMRCARMKADARNRDDPLLTPEMASRGLFLDETVMHVETNTRVETKRRRQASALQTLHEAGRLTNHQFEAAENIASASRAIRGEVRVRGSSVEARVDCNGSATQHLIEHIRQAHLARAYRRWWASGVRVPRAMILEMIVQDAGLKRIARQHRVGWPRAERMLRDSLDSFNCILERVMHEIDQRDLEAFHMRLQRAA